MLRELLEFLPTGWKPAKTRRVQWLYSLSSVPSRRKPGQTLHQLYTNGILLTRGSDLDRIRSAFAFDLRTILAMVSPWRVFIHAGAVGWKGKAILLPGDSGSGKTTLTIALVRAGATLLSDEFAVLDRKGLVHPYSIPLRVKKVDSPGSFRVPLAELGGEAAEKPLPVGLVLATRFDPKARGGLQRLTPGRAALNLMAHANQARTRPDRVMESVGRATAGAICLRGPRGEANEIVDRLLDLW